MKRILLFIFMLISTRTVIAQTEADGNLGALPTLGGLIFYSGVDSVDGVKKDDLYNRAKSHLSTVFPNFKDVVKLDDKDLGKLVVRGMFTTTPKGNGIIVSYIEFIATTTIMVKDGRYRFEISDFVHPVNSYLSYQGLEQIMFNKKTTEKRSPLINDVMQEYISGIKKALSTTPQNW
ncbi:DUF4468 domain-containing protein [Chitinophaga eiseniae]|nr:DUF4468 domain-containing protein [Chitinophaga eiseniae]